MNRRQLLRNGILSGVGMVASPLLSLGRCRLWAADTDPVLEVSTRAVDLVLGSTVIDMLGFLTLDWPKLFRWQRQPTAFQEPDFRQLETTGVNIFHPAVDTRQSHAYEAALHWMSGWNNLIAAQACFLSRVDAITDFTQVPRLGKLGVLLGFQNSTHFRTVADVAFFFRLGQRVSQLTYNEHNRLGSGCYEKKDRGLTAFGADVVAEMNRLGMIVDISHCGERTSREAIAASRQPVLVTHSNCQALVPGQPRCKSDDLIRRLAERGGVMGITAVRAFVGRRKSPTLDDLLDHFDHVVQVAGVEHVGLGSDVDFNALDPATGRIRSFYAIRGLVPRVRIFQIADGLLRRGYREDDVRLVLGGNFLRVLASIFPAPRGPMPERLTRRDPFCPAPHRVNPFAPPERSS